MIQPEYKDTPRGKIVEYARSRNMGLSVVLARLACRVGDLDLTLKATRGRDTLTVMLVFQRPRLLC